MKAVILAGGKGTRLAPYTTVFPKPLVPLGNRPILHTIISQLSYYGFKDIVLSVGYLAELIKAYFQNVDLPEGTKISYVQEKVPAGTAGSISLVPELNESFLVMNGDILTTMDYSKLLSYHKEMGGIMTIGMNRKSVKIDLGVLETGDDGVVTDYIEKPEKTYSVSMGVYVYEPSVLKYIEPGQYLDMPDLVHRLLADGEKVAGYLSDAFWLDIGRHDDYALAQEEFEKRKDAFLPG